MVETDLAEKWLNKAEEDFKYASSSLDEELEFFAQICFHFHQSAEKHWKAYIVRNKLEFRKIHDLIELWEICSKHNPAFIDSKESCAILNRYYLETRYPVHWESNVTREDALQARSAAEKIQEAIYASLHNSNEV